MIEQITVNPINEKLFSAEFLKGFRCGAKRQYQADVEEIAKAKFGRPTADRPKNMIHIDDVYRLVAGHSDYHGDSILSAFTCLVEGKDVKPIAPLDESADRPTDKLIREVVSTLIYTEGDDAASVAFRNAGRLVQNAMDGEPPEFEKIPSSDRPTGWIPVSERLPEKDGRYLVCMSWNYHDMDVYMWADGWNCIRRINGGVDRTSEIDGTDIVAWMSLPEPYREDGEA